jgi:hypothetical protein
LTNVGFDKLFGQRLFSARSVIVAAALSSGSAFVSETVFNLVVNETLTVTYLVLGPLLLIAALAPLINHRLGILPGAALAVAATATFATAGMAALPMLVLAVLIGPIAAVFFIVITRRILRYASSAQSVVAISILLLVNLCMGVALVLPLFAGRAIGRQSANWVAGILWESLGGVLASVNIPPAAAAASIFVVGAVLLFDTLFWFFLERPVYAAARYGLLQRKKTLGAIGLALITAATPAFGLALQQVLLRFSK